MKTNFDMDVGQKQAIGLQDIDRPYTDLLYFYLPMTTITKREEFLVYDRLSFMADCAGMGGILLGLSMLTGFEWVSNVIQRAGSIYSLP